MNIFKQQLNYYAIENFCLSQVKSIDFTNKLNSLIAEYISYFLESREICVIFKHENSGTNLETLFELYNEQIVIKDL